MRASSRTFMNIAHRGYSGVYPENTLLAFEKAIELGCTWLECDVRLTRDGVPVVIHDATVDRTTDRVGAVNQLSWREIRTLDAGSWKAEAFRGERIPSLEKMLAAIDGRAQIVVEIKCETAKADVVVDTIEQMNAVSWTVASAFEWETIRRVRELSPCWRTTWLTNLREITPVEAVDRCVAAEVDTLGPDANRTDESLVQKAHAEGLLVRCWGLGDDRGPEMRRLVEIGVDGMTTNWPDDLAAIISG